jgi:iron(III) transport system ATP-binding protein
MTLLSVYKISKAYPGESLGAVNQVSLDMKAGEIMSFVGESGSGKSTLLRMLAGLLKPDEGQITFQGSALENPEEQLIAGNPAIKMVFQDFELMPNMTVAENLKYPLLAYDKAYAEERVQELMSLCSISSLATKLPRELSGGQQQRVALARALADEPELLLMDEPFSQLDPVNKSQLLREILQILKTARVGLIFVTHDTRDALMISDRIGFLQQGKLVQMGTSTELYSSPENLDIARFFGAVNVFDRDVLKQYLPGLWAKLDDEKLKSVGVRAEDVLPGEQAGMPAVAVKIEKEYFMGDHYLVEAEAAWGGRVTFYAHAPTKTQQNELQMSFSMESLLYFYQHPVS